MNGIEKIIKAHRLRFYTEHRFVPESIDHINGVRDDNRIENLRAANPTQQQWNQLKVPGCSSKYKGVTWHKRDCKWQASIKVYGKKRFLGYFDSEEDAAEAYRTEAKKLHKEFYREC